MNLKEVVKSELKRLKLKESDISKDFDLPVQTIYMSYYRNCLSKKLMEIFIFCGLDQEKLMPYLQHKATGNKDKYKIIYAHGYQLTDLCQQIGKTQNYMSKIINGKIKPRPKNKALMSEKLFDLGFSPSDVKEIFSQGEL